MFLTIKEKKKKIHKNYFKIYAKPIYLLADREKENPVQNKGEVCHCNSKHLFYMLSFKRIHKIIFSYDLLLKNHKRKTITRKYECQKKITRKHLLNG